MTIPEELKEQIAEELYDWEGRFGSHAGILWERISDNTKNPYREEAKFILAEFVIRAGWIPPEEAKGMVKLSKDQTFPPGIKAVEKILKERNWRKVILEEKK